MTLNGDQTADRAGITYRQLAHWVKQGYLPVTSPRRFNDREFEFVALMASLVREGITPSAASRLARELTDDGEAWLGNYVLRRAA